LFINIKRENMGDAIKLRMIINNGLYSTKA